MTIWDRISKGVRDAIDPPGTGGAGPSGPGGGTGAGGVGGARGGSAQGPAVLSLADKLGLTKITDDALGSELERRRRLRAKNANRRPAADEELDAMNAVRRARTKSLQVSKAYRHLELAPGASRGQIERAFRSQLRQYHPDRFIGDQESHQSSVALVVSLIDAYLLLLGR